MVVGVVFDPIRQEMFTAERGSGAWLNNGLSVSRIGVSAVSRLDSSLLCTGFPTRRRHLSVNVHFYHQLAMATHGVRRTGSAAIDLAWVACGRLDGFWEFGLKPWDMAAGRLLVAEAGGRVSDMRDKPHDFDSPHLLADNGHLHGQIVEIFGEVFEGRYRVPIPLISRSSDCA